MKENELIQAAGGFIGNQEHQRIAKENREEVARRAKDLKARIGMAAGAMATELKAFIPGSPESRGVRLGPEDVRI